ncbi:hypothetical protein [Pseudoteredinibacter isoporae]|uniref:hypothetical protein n=1 Tax=Pseudoteredinibacter isoporae TaxID=570281 RepID=UPI003103B36C
MLTVNKSLRRGLIVSFLSLLFTMGVAYAQQESPKADEKDDKANAAEQKTRDAAKAQSKGKASTKKNNERFVPTEEISEDLPVAFPVDI